MIPTPKSEGQPYKILIDEIHQTVPWVTTSTWSSFVSELEMQGYVIEALTSGEISSVALQGYNVLLIGCAWADFSVNELQAIEDFVYDGGSLFLIGVGWSWIDYHPGSTIQDYPMNRIASNLGLFFNDDVIFDPTDNTGDPGNPIFHRMLTHPITEGISEVCAPRGNPCSISISSTTIIITGDEDSYSGYHESVYEAGDYPPVLLTTFHGNGKIVCSGHDGFFSNNDDDSDGTINLYEYDNLPLGLNIIDWLVQSDIDNDALLDVWEIYGIDYDGDRVIDLDLPSLGADPYYKDIYLEIDWMEDGSHSHRPEQQALDIVIEAFSTAPVSNPNGFAGINLHIDLSNAVSHNDKISWVGIPFVVADFYDIKTANFDQNRRFAFHYCIFAHLPPLGSYSGVAELPGNDYIVTLGGFTNGVGTVQQQAGTLMHELGHNLGLRHGGDVNTNYNPNYLSIMNYWFQFGIPFSDRLDYSSGALPSLNENDLNELNGIQDGSDWTFFYDTVGNTRMGAGSGSIDWDWDGIIESSVNVDVNGDSSRSLLNDYNDWSNLVFNFQDTIAFADGVNDNMISQEEEIDYETASHIEQIKKTYSPKPVGGLIIPINIFKLSFAWFIFGFAILIMVLAIRSRR